jgi:hypothetical protein
MRITAACPQALIADANQLSMVLAMGPADANTYSEPGWQDTDGNMYSAASWPANLEWVQVAQGALVRPEWDETEMIDMEAAQRAQAAAVFSLEPVLALPGKLTACCGDSALEALAAMGLVLLDAEGI